MTTSELKLNQQVILAEKRRHLQARQQKTPVEAVIAMATMQRRPRQILNRVMNKQTRVRLIGQISRAATYDPVAAALRYVRAGADAVSFFTDNVTYANDLDDLLMVAMGVKHTPVIYQNYVINEYNVIEARASDASALVLHADVLEPDMLRKVVSITQRWMMATLVQVTTPHDLRIAAELVPHAIAVGHSESHDVQTMLDQLEWVRPQMPFNTRLLGFTCLNTLDEVEAAVQGGVDAVIVSEEVLNTPSRLSRLQHMLHRL